MTLNTDTTERTLEQIISDMRAAYIDAADRLHSSTSPQTVHNYHAEAKATAELMSLRLWREFDDDVIGYDEWMGSEKRITALLAEAAKLADGAFALMDDQEIGL
jgi:hypothetical protein